MYTAEQVLEALAPAQQATTQRMIEEIRARGKDLNLEALKENLKREIESCGVSNEELQINVGRINTAHSVLHPDGALMEEFFQTSNTVDGMYHLYTVICLINTYRRMEGLTFLEYADQEVAKLLKRVENSTPEQREADYKLAFKTVEHTGKIMNIDLDHPAMKMGIADLKNMLNVC